MISISAFFFFLLNLLTYDVTASLTTSTSCINTVAGGATKALPAFQSPSSIDRDTSGALIFSASSAIYRINDDERTSIRTAGVDPNEKTISSTGYSGDGGPAASARFGGDVTVIKSIREGGSLLVLDPKNNAVRIIYQNGTISTYFSCLQTSFGGDGGHFRSPGFLCSLGLGLAESPDGDLYFSDRLNNRIRKISFQDGIVTTIAGTGNAGWTNDGGRAISANIEAPELIAISPDGSTLAFVGAVNGTYNGAPRVIRSVKLTSGQINHLAGCNANVIKCEPNGDIATLFSIAGPITGLGFRPLDSALTFINRGDLTVRTISEGKITILAGTGKRGRTRAGILANSADLNSPSGLFFDPKGDLYISDSASDQLLFINAQTNVISTILYATPPAINILQEKNVLATQTLLSGPAGLLSTPIGDILIADSVQNTIRILRSDGTIGTLAGDGEPCVDPTSSCGDGLPATSAQLNAPLSMALLKNGDLIIVDSSCGKIRKISAASSIITTIVGTGVIGYKDGIANESFIGATSVAVDDNNAIYMADFVNSRIRKIQANVVTTVAGDGSKLVGNSGAVPSVNGGSVATTVSVPGPLMLAFGPDKLLYISDIIANAIFRFNPADGKIELFAFKPWQTIPPSGGIGDGGHVSNAIIYSPAQLAFDSIGNLYVAESKGNRIRMISASNRFVSTVAGNGTSVTSGDGGSPVSALLSSPRGLTIDPFNNLFFSEEGSLRVRELSFGATPNCPAGFTCPCGLRPEPCLNPAFFCPAGSTQPTPVSPGFMAIGLSLYSSTVDKAFYSQSPCPIGKFCSNGIAYECPSGTFGRAPMQPTSASCRKCEPGSYTAEKGAIGNATGNACLQCPAGTYTNNAGSSTCFSCPPNTFSIFSGGTNSSSCIPCPNGTWSFPWMTTCTPLGKMDFFKVNDTLTTFQRTFEFNDENMGPSRLLRLEILVGAPIFGICCIPLLLAIMSKYCCPNTVFAESIFFILYLLRRNDLFCDLAHPVEKGEAATRKPTPIGGGFSLAFVGLFLAFSAMVTLEFVFSNNIAVYTLLPMSYLISNIIRTIPSKPVDSSDLNYQFPLLSSGFAIYIQSAGRFCNAPLRFSQNLVQGSFRNISLFDSSTGDATHVFQCGNCFTDELSFFVATFHPSCTKFTVSVVTVGAWGSINARMLDVESTSYVFGSFELKPEVSLDFVNGTDDENNPNIPVGGKTFRGYDLGYVTVYSNADANPENPVPSTIRIELPLAPMYSRVTVTPILTYFNLVSTYIGNLGVLGGAAVAFSWYLFVLDKFRTLKHGKPMFVIFGSSFDEAKKQWGLEYFRDPPTREVNKDHRDTKKFIADAFKNDPRYKDLYANQKQSEETVDGGTSGQRSSSAGPSLEHSSFTTMNPINEIENGKGHGHRSSSISTVRKIMPAISTPVVTSRWSAFKGLGGGGGGGSEVDSSKFMMELRNRDTGQSWYVPVKQKASGALVGSTEVWSAKRT